MSRAEEVQGAVDLTYDASALIAFGQSNRAARHQTRMLVEENGAILHVPALSVMLAYARLPERGRRVVGKLISRSFALVHPLDLASARQVGAFAGTGAPKPFAALQTAIVAIKAGTRILTAESGQYYQLTEYISKDRLLDLETGWEDDWADNELF